MSSIRTTALLCASLALAAPAWAEDAAPFVTQLRLPARDTALDTFAWRRGDDVLVSRADLARLSIQAPGAEERVSLASVPGLTYALDDAAAAIVLTCSARCFDVQRLAPRAEHTASPLQNARGAYMNYDAEAQWLDGRGVVASGVAEGAMFGPWGLVESSWLGASTGEARGLARLETRWTVDRPEQHLRMRIGDSSAIAASGAPVRFGGVQIGRHFGLQPSLITHPTATLSGEAQSASTVELYVDGALRAREHVAAGPFAFENAPLVTGAGEAELVVTDVAGRQQVITRPFFVSMALLRPGLSDWSVSAGAERLAFGRENADYGESFVSGRYRLGLTNTVTAEAGIDVGDASTTFQAGATAAHIMFGQVRLAHAETADGGATEAAWLYQTSRWSLGLQSETRDPSFSMLGLRDNRLLRSTAMQASVNLEHYGSASFVAAAVDEVEASEARTYALSYSPDLTFGTLTARLLYTEREERELSFGLHFALALDSDISHSFAYEIDDYGATYRASSQRSPAFGGGDGWRARSVFGRQQRLEFSGSRRGRIGDTVVQVARTQEDVGARLQHSGSIGAIEGYRFAARPIRGAFALVDVGSPNVGIARDRLNIGATGRDGRVIATGLRPYDVNAISLSADDLPFDHATAATEIRVAPGEGAGVVVRFTESTQTLTEAHARMANGAFAMRGDILIRLRDGARFPIGANGRVVLLGLERGDVFELASNRRCSTAGGENVTSPDLVISCAA
ncbi:fimbria/pilus outer membrane usher protein [Terricaulis silvestris]|uniref:F1 capsule-anchoring protein n=1 Tax=Terricaulis silvestris TaxID=2686094 RepID=A0A6I6MGN8_9CAUL|nr:fimbria/pilus outer membrane usher protein [Terricaulis silvestris]QGZ93830.1 F1 capsule-anchoring protein precursor [Terricaulis silvestris]